jgi:hypothetical protein
MQRLPMLVLPRIPVFPVLVFAALPRHRTVLRGVGCHQRFAVD